LAVASAAANQSNRSTSQNFWLPDLIIEPLHNPLGSRSQYNVGS
jgi:hypothetical protein